MRMTTTTGDSKTPASLSGGDLVSRLLAATPPYLYNVPLTPHSFFFSEMLRSFVQTKSEPSTSTSVTTNNSTAGRRRKRSWRDVRDRPLELTTKDRSTAVGTHSSHQDKYFHQEPVDGRYKEASVFDETPSAAHPTMNFDRKPLEFSETTVKNDGENRSEFLKHGRHFFDDSSSRIFTGGNNASQTAQDFEETQKINRELGFLNDQKPKMDFSARNFLPVASGRSEDLSQVSKAFGMASSGGVAANNTDFIPNPLWYPTYPIPQSYPAIDPLHFFIDLRVSGHIWDRKMNERQLPFKGKHCSAFSVPQAKEYNRPLNLTRDEATTSKNEENTRSTHFILKNLTTTYREIERQSLRIEKNDLVMNSKNIESVGNRVKEDSTLSSQEESAKESNSKDLRALIGLELVVDYVKEPKEEPIVHQCLKESE